MNQAELESRIRAAAERFDKLPRWEQIRLLREQKISWVVGELKLANITQTRETVDRTITKMDNERKPRAL